MSKDRGAAAGSTTRCFRKRFRCPSYVTRPVLAARVTLCYYKQCRARGSLRISTLRGGGCVTCKRCSRKLGKRISRYFTFLEIFHTLDCFVFIWMSLVYYFQSRCPSSTHRSHLSIEISISFDRLSLKSIGFRESSLFRCFFIVMIAQYE